MDYPAMSCDKVVERNKHSNDDLHCAVIEDIEDLVLEDGRRFSVGGRAREACGRVVGLGGGRGSAFSKPSVIST